MAGKCKICNSFDEYAEPNSAGDYYCYIHFIDIKHVCLYCVKTPANLVCSRTSYNWDGIGDDPNKDIYLCEKCEIFHNEYYDDMYIEYYQGVL